MRRFVFVNVVCGILGVVALAGAPLSRPIAHEKHAMECSETNINAMSVDIQSMPDGDAKTTATTEMNMAQQTMANKDMKACMSHMQKAVEALEE